MLEVSFECFAGKDKSHRFLFLSILIVMGIPLVIIRFFLPWGYPLDAFIYKWMITTRWCLPVISWFIIPLTIDISTISPSEIRVINQLSYHKSAINPMKSPFSYGFSYDFSMGAPHCTNLAILGAPLCRGIPISGTMMPERSAETSVLSWQLAMPGVFHGFLLGIPKLQSGAPKIAKLVYNSNN